MDGDAVFVQSHFSINDLAEKAFPIPRAHRHEIRAGLGVIMPFQAYRSPVMSIWVVVSMVPLWRHDLRFAQGEDTPWVGRIAERMFQCIACDR